MWFLLLTFEMYVPVRTTLTWAGIYPGVVKYIYNSATLEAEFRNGVGSVPIRGNSASIGGWIEYPPSIQHRERSLTEYWDLTES